MDPPEAGNWIWSARSAPDPAEDCSPRAGANPPGHRVDPGSTLHWERWEALRQLVLAYETLSMAAWSKAIHHLALQVVVNDPAPDHQLEISRARELLKENAWATRQRS